MLTKNSESFDALDVDQSTSGVGRVYRLSDLQGLNLTELRSEWRRLFRASPPLLSRDLIIRGLAYRMQELQAPGASRVAQKRIKALQKQAQGGIEPAGPVGSRIKPGSRLIREWHGRTHVVTVTEAGFDYDGRAYASLTRIANQITGAHWSGPRFFGLVGASKIKQKSGEAV
ncbi:DUF2924 domain-containing protein [Microvirga sp. 2YAF29]|uniref:DUF2924 domain-containing protein n=1 Tax=Microvirga sp. 2YAF29 TaxID=3233031 RepID=UPI003F9895AA